MSEAPVSDAGAAAVVPGWFGKMPRLGDFASRRLPDEFVAPWDDWLQRGIAHAQAELGADWIERYLVAPVRRFWLSPGLLGEGAWAGVLMPSVDSVGRHFPMTVAATLEAPAGSLAAVLSALDWFEAMDAAARRVLDPAFTPDDFERVLAQAALVPLLAPPDSQSQGALLAADLLAPLMRHDPPAAGIKCSLWWCGRPADTMHFDAFPGLPPASFAAVLAETDEVR